MRLKPITIVALFLALSPISRAEEVFRIEIGKDPHKYSNSELQRRVWELERAVWQLQQRVFQLEAEKVEKPAEATWVCTISALGDNYTGTGTTKALATANSIENCKKARGDGFFCKSPKCEQ